MIRDGGSTRFFTLSMDSTDRGKLSWKATREAAGKSAEIKRERKKNEIGHEWNPIPMGSNDF